MKVISTCSSSRKRMRFWIFTDAFESFKATSHLTIFVPGMRAKANLEIITITGTAGPCLTGRTSSVSLIFTHLSHQNVKNRRVRSRLQEVS